MTQIVYFYLSALFVYLYYWTFGAVDHQEKVVLRKNLRVYQAEVTFQGYDETCIVKILGLFRSDRLEHML